MPYLKFISTPRCPCDRHREYRKGCPDCFDRNRTRTLEELDAKSGDRAGCLDLDMGDPHAPPTLARSAGWRCPNRRVALVHHP